MRTIVMETSHESYNYKEEIIWLHVNMGNAKTESNGRRDREEPVTMRSLQKEV
jgi:hypothetical protein